MQTVVKRNSFKIKELCKLKIYRGFTEWPKSVNRGVTPPLYDLA